MPNEFTFGQRLRLQRERAGKSRAVFGGLVGRSAEWVKAVENGRLHQPRLPMLLRMADVLGLRDLAALTGNQSLPVASLTRNAHDGLDAVREAMIRYRLPDSAPSVDQLADRAAEAWAVWHGTAEHRTAVAALLPTLLVDARTAVRQGEDRRKALAVVAKVYNLAQAYLAFQPAPELVWMAADRALAAAYEADDPAAVTGAAWYAEQVHRAAGHADKALAVALDAVEMLPTDPDDQDMRACAGLLYLSAAEAYAALGEDGPAWRSWDQADEIARALGAGYVHPWLMFGRGIVENYAILLDTDLFHTASAIRRANQVDLSIIPSRTRRAVQSMNHARAYSLNGEHLAVLHLIKQAYGHAPETVRYRPWARETVLDLMESGGPMVRGAAREMAGVLGVLD